MNSMKAFVYLAEHQTLKELLPEWPSEMRIALGLHKSGICELIVFHRNEANKIINRMARILNLPVGRFGIVPEKRGYPTKTMRFSDQQQLLKLITAEKDLCETASDYEINYRFAKEEGLDPLHFTGHVYKASKPVKKPNPNDSAMVVPFRSRQIRPAANEATYFKGSFAETALIEMHGRYMRITLNPDTVTHNISVLRVAKVAQREEQNQFILERSLLGNWKTGSSAIFEIPTEKLAGRLSSNYFKHPYIEAVLIVPHGIFVTYNLKIKTGDPASSPKQPKSYPFDKTAMRGSTFADNQKIYI